MHDASPPRPRLVAFVASFVVASALATSVTVAADETPPYFSERFGGTIERVVVGPDGTIYVAGLADAADLPASTSTPDPWSDTRGGSKGLFFAAALEPDGRPRWTSYVVGQAIALHGLAIAPDGSVWLAASGYAVPVSAFLTKEFNAWSADGVVAKFAPDGTLLFASELGGVSEDRVSDLALAANGDAIVCGTTCSADFPSAPLTPIDSYCHEDAFVARIRADGSGIVWVRRFGNDFAPGGFHGGGVSVDPSDGTIVVGMTGTPNQSRAPFATALNLPPGDRNVRRVPRGDGPLVVRLDATGVQAQGAQLLGLGTIWASTPVPITIETDGSVLAGGQAGVARTPSELFLGVTDWWTRVPERWQPAVVARICTDASGRVVIGERWYDASNHAYDTSYHVRIVVRDASLADGEESVDRETGLGFVPADFTVDAAGSLIVVGNGPGVPFRATSDAPGGWTGCVARVPLDGMSAPTRLRARVAGTREADLVWSRDGDAASGFDIERVGHDAPPRLLGHVSGDVFRFHATGLTPGAVQGLRVVAVFPSGERFASPARWVTTVPDPPLEVVATDGPGRTIDVRWTDVNGAVFDWAVQRRFGDSEWMWVPRPGPGDTALSPTGVEPRVVVRTDVVPDVAVPVRYRVLSILWLESGGLVSGWTESAPIVPASSLRVVQTRGRFVAGSSQGAELLVEGTFSLPDEAGFVSFDPATQDFRLLYGYANQPGELALPRGYPGWTVADGVARWRAADSLTGWEDGSEIALDFVHGTFVVRLVAGYWPQSSAIGSIAVNLEIGANSGGDVQRWRGTPGPSASLRFDAAAQREMEARAR